MPKLFTFYQMYPLVLPLRQGTLSWQSQKRFVLQDLVIAQWTQESLIYASLMLPHQTNAEEPEMEGVFPDHISRQVCRYTGFSQAKM